MIGVPRTWHAPESDLVSRGEKQAPWVMMKARDFLLPLLPLLLLVVSLTALVVLLFPSPAMNLWRQLRDHPFPQVSLNRDEALMPLVAPAVKDSDATTEVQQGLRLLFHGQCEEALSHLKTLPAASGPRLTGLTVQVGAANCIGRVDGLEQQIPIAADTLFGCPLQERISCWRAIEILTGTPANVRRWPQHVVSKFSEHLLTDRRLWEAHHWQLRLYFAYLRKHLEAVDLKRTALPPADLRDQLTPLETWVLKSPQKPEDLKSLLAERLGMGSPAETAVRLIYLFDAIGKMQTLTPTVSESIAGLPPERQQAFWNMAIPHVMGTEPERLPDLIRWLDPVLKDQISGRALTGPLESILDSLGTFQLLGLWETHSHLARMLNSASESGVPVLLLFSAAATARNDYNNARRFAQECLRLAEVHLNSPKTPPAQLPSLKRSKSGCQKALNKANFYLYGPDTQAVTMRGAPTNYRDLRFRLEAQWQQGKIQEALEQMTASQPAGRNDREALALRLMDIHTKLEARASEKLRDELDHPSIRHAELEDADLFSYEQFLWSRLERMSGNLIEAERRITWALRALRINPSLAVSVREHVLVEAFVVFRMAGKSDLALQTSKQLMALWQQDYRLDEFKMFLAKPESAPWKAIHPKSPTGAALASLASP